MEMLQNAPHLWLIAGGILIVLEFILMPGIGFLFAGLGALTAGLALVLGLADNQVVQWIIFFATTILWTALLWKPLKNFRLGHSGKDFNDMIGHKAVLLEDLTPGITGRAKWSGTIMNAKLEAASNETLLKNSEVTIVEVNGNVLTVR